mgnify:CR=1 FL=1
MEVAEGLKLADELVYAKTGKHLNDLEREVFIGSWQGKVYEEIYPLNPEYIEKDVGYKLWKKLSNALEEKVSKKSFRGAIERVDSQNRGRGRSATTSQPAVWQDGKTSFRAYTASPPPVVEKFSETLKIFISYRAQEPDNSLAAKLQEAIASTGYQVFLSALGSMVGEKGWLEHLDNQLQQCNYFLLLLSPQTAASEMAIEELRRVKSWRDRAEDFQPVVLPIRVSCPASLALNHDLRGYLDGIVQREWRSPADTADLIQEILTLLAEKGNWNAVLPEEEEKTRDWETETKPPIPNPLPVAEPELPSGQVRLASAFYVERSPYESQCYKEILQPGALIRIKAPRQMGKTSLMARILYQAKEQGYRTVPLSFQHADTAVFSNLNQLLRWFCSRIARKLRLPQQIDDYWSDTYGSKDNCTAYFEDCLLSNDDQPLVLGLDEVDRVFQYPKIADDFFGLLRAWYEEAGYGDSDSGMWQKLRMVVVHSTEVYIPLNVNQSPFNVGLPIELPEFSAEQVQDLTWRHGLNWQGEEVAELMALIGGHPYLVRVALYHLAQQNITLPGFLKTAPTEAGLYDDHLRRHLWSLQQYPELANAFSRAVRAIAPVELESIQAFKLHSMGLVQMQGNQVIPRFNLYRQYFCDRLTTRS